MIRGPSSLIPGAWIFSIETIPLTALRDLSFDPVLLGILPEANN